MTPTMASIHSIIEAAAQSALRASWQAAALAIIVGLIQAAFGGRLAPRWRYALWGLVVARLLLPYGVRTQASAWNYFGHHGAAARSATASIVPVTSGAAPSAVPSVVIGSSNVTPTFHEASAPRSGASPGRSQTSVWLFAEWVWLGVAAILIARLFGASLLVGRRIRRMKKAAPEDLRSLVRSCAAELRIARPPIVIEGPAGTFPSLIGLWRPVLLLPANLANELDGDQMRLVVLHELMHQRRLDVAANWLLSILGAVHWFNPVLWWAFGRVRVERELACDAAVVERAGEVDGRRRYAELILNLVESLSRRELPAGAVGICEDGRQIKRRLAMIMRAPRPSRRSALLAGLLALGVGVVTLTEPVGGQEKRAAAAAATVAAASQPSARAIEAASVFFGAPGRGDAGAILTDDERAERVLNNQTAERLRRPLSEIAYADMPLAEVLTDFAKQAGADVNVNWRALETAGIEKGAPISLKSHGIPAGRALGLILQNAGGGNVLLDYRIDAGAVHVSTADENSKYTSTVVYDIHELMGSLEDKALTSKLEGLVKLIQDSVSPDSWRENGGSIGGIRVFDTKLVITQTSRNQGEIVVLLEKLNTKR